MGEVAHGRSAVVQQQGQASSHCRGRGVVATAGSIVGVCCRRGDSSQGWGAAVDPSPGDAVATRGCIARVGRSSRSIAGVTLSQRGGALQGGSVAGGAGEVVGVGHSGWGWAGR